MVRNWLTSTAEKIQYITPDGEKYNLHNPYKKAVLEMSGWGLPAASIADSRGPFQHGSNPLTVRIPPREVRLRYRYNGCSREEYWDGRMDLVNALRLNRSNLNNPEPGHLKWYHVDGNVYQLDVMVVDGPKFPTSREGWDGFGYTDDIIFLAHNPIIYKPTLINDSFSDLGCTIAETLQFPFTFGTSNIIFAGTSCNAVNDLTVNYLGNWQTFPLITVTGPATDFSITHSQTGLKIALTGYTINAGDSVVFDLTYGRKTVTLTSTGASLLGYISTDSDLGSFAVEPDPIVTGGVNTFEVSIDDGTGDTLVSFQYYTRFIGI